MRATIIGTIGWILAAACLAGCSALKFNGGASPVPSATANASAPPTAGSGGASPPAALAQAQRTHEYPSPPEHQSARGIAADPVTAVEAFATPYINWTAATVAATMRALAGVSIGQARSEMALAAAQTAQDYELKRGGIVNTGTVEAIAPVLGHRDEYAVVTREQTTATATSAYTGLRPAWHVALATVAELTGGRWVLSVWQPEN